MNFYLIMAGFFLLSSAISQLASNSIAYDCLDKNEVYSKNFPSSKGYTTFNIVLGVFMVLLSGSLIFAGFSEKAQATISKVM